MRMVVTDGPEQSDPGMASALTPYSRFSQQDALQLHAEKQGVGYHQYGAVVNYKREIDNVREEMNAKDTEIARLNSKFLQMEKSKSSEGEDRDFRITNYVKCTNSDCMWVCNSGQHLDELEVPWYEEWLTSSKVLSYVTITRVLISNTGRVSLERLCYQFAVWQIL